MQTNNWEDFDLKLRSELENAEVKAPRHVWRGIESRLDAAAPATPVWKFAGWGVAALAALSAALFFIFNTGNSEQLYKETNPVTLAESICGVTEISSLESTSEAVKAASEAVSPEKLERKVTGAARRSSASAQVETAPVTAVTATRGETYVQEGTAVREEVTVHEGPAAAPAENTPVYSDSQTYSDPFAAMAAEDARKAKSGVRISYSASGTLGSNLDAGNKAPLQSRAPGKFDAGNVKSGVYEDGPSTYGVPVTFGLGVKFHITDRFSVGTGIDYSFLTRKFSGIYLDFDALGSAAYSGDINHTMHYLGIPLNLYYDVISGEKFRLYLMGGGEAEYCVANNYDIRTEKKRFHYNEAVNGLQFSVGLGFGAEMNLTRNMSLFLDPTVRYYFDNNQPKSIRTDKQFMIGVDLGLRFDF